MDRFALQHMKSPLKSILALLLLTLSAYADPFVVNDRSLKEAFQKGVGKFADDGNHRSGEDFAKSLKDCPLTCEAPPRVTTAPDDPTKSVFLVGTVYKCGKCDKWHPGGIATAWCLSADGLMVTNHHVFDKAKGAAMGICDRDGNTWPVTELLAANSAADLAVFRVEGKDFTPLPLGKPAEIGADVRVISHPDGRYYMQTFGDVARYHARPKLKNQPPVIWMSITADYAKGSSGGPVLNENDEVVGMVASTRSIYYDSNDGKPKGPLQMVIKNCVPVAAVAEMIRPETDS